jgi:hypothetical protein
LGLDVISKMGVQTEPQMLVLWEKKKKPSSSL